MKIKIRILEHEFVFNSSIKAVNFIETLTTKNYTIKFKDKIIDFHELKNLWKYYVLNVKSF